MRGRGYSLVELLLALAILSVVIAGISLLLVQQSLLSAKQELQRSLETNGRLALLEIAGAVRLAGYGIAPTAAFDMDRVACTTPGTGSTCNGGGRDRADAPDELVVAWRDPAFTRRAIGLVGTAPTYALTLDRALTQPLAADRILLLLCSGAEPSAYLALQTAAAAGDTGLTVRTLGAADGYFPAAAPTDACFASASVFSVERRRYFIQADGTGMPCLYRDRGRGLELLQRGIEDLQISYAIGAPPLGSAFASGGGTPATPPAVCGGVNGWVYGACAGTAGAPAEAAIAPDWRLDSYDSARRYTGHPANVRSVTIAIVARSTQDSPDKRGDDLPIVGNRPARAFGTWKRSVFSVTETTVNLLTRAHFLPPVMVGLDANVGGG